MLWDLPLELLLVRAGDSTAHRMAEAIGGRQGSPGRAPGSGPRFSLELAHGLADVRDRLAKGHLDAILLDIGPDLDQGLAALEALMLLEPDVPTVVLLGMDNPDEELAASAACIRRGASDAVPLAYGAEEVLRLVVLARERHALLRTRDSERQRLVNERERLEGKIRELEAFAHRLAHELKAPVRAALLRLQQLTEALDASATAEAREAAQGMGGRLTLMARLIDDVLAAEGAAVRPAVPTVVDVRALLKDILKLLDPGPAVNVVLDVEVAPLLTHRAALHSVLQNLVGNAIKHASKEDPTIVVTARDAGTHLAVSVQDTGPGIPVQDRDRVFQLFAARQPGRADSTGIGLPLARRLVESSGGTIALESPAGGGTLVRFTWPRAAVGSFSPVTLAADKALV